MNCPIDGTGLQLADRQGIEIDYCPKCRGVWLDRGELDKLIERTTLGGGFERPFSGDERRGSDHGAPRSGRKRSPLADLFDLG